MVVGGNESVLAVNHTGSAALFHQLGPVEVIPDQGLVGNPHNSRANFLGGLDNGGVPGGTHAGFRLFGLLFLGQGRFGFRLSGSLGAGQAAAGSQKAGAEGKSHQGAQGFLGNGMFHNLTPCQRTLLTISCCRATNSWIFRVRGLSSSTARTVL